MQPPFPKFPLSFFGPQSRDVCLEFGLAQMKKKYVGHAARVRDNYYGIGTKAPGFLDLCRRNNIIRRYDGFCFPVHLYRI